MSVSTKTYSILGAARSGIAIATLLRGEGARVFVSDSKLAETASEAIGKLRQIGAEYEFGGHSQRVLESDVLVLSPGVPDTIPIVEQARANGLEITNELELASQRCRAPIIAITGTNGKTTTTELTGHIVRNAGRQTFVAGNIGLPFSEIALSADENSVVVIEASSFQLEHVSSFRPRVAVVLNITPDHMDRYDSLEEYSEAKFRITMNQREGDVLIYNADDERLAMLPGRSHAHAIGFSIRRELPEGAFLRNGDLVLRLVSGSGGEGITRDNPGTITEETLMRADEIRIRGPHNLYNAMAAALSARMLGLESGTVRESLQSFPGVPHRLEPVRELDGICYVNDSKATNVDSLWYALSSFSEPIVLIAGGKSKKNVYDAVLPLVAKHVKAVVLIGDAAGEIEAAFSGLTAIHHAGYSMENALTAARSIAEHGDVILLSPACASFDMFNNYEHRGDVFRTLVEELQSVMNVE